MIRVDKAVAAVTRVRRSQPQLLVFDHPSAGSQIVKGTVEDGESVEDAVVRELFEESGLVVESAGTLIGRWERIVGGGPSETGTLERNLWHVFDIEAPPNCPTGWEHAAVGSPAEEGLVFAFRWVPIGAGLADSLHPLFEPVAHMIAAYHAS